MTDGIMSGQSSPAEVSDHDLIYSCGYARLVIGHGPDALVVKALVHWCTAAEAELARRGLAAEAKRIKARLWKEHPRRTENVNSI